jgi:CMP/dCMP kinase
MSSRPDGIIVVIDGPAASGKSTTAQAVAAELGYRYLDSGAFYRAITLAALRAALPPDHWDRLSVDDIHRLAVRARPHGAGYALEIAGTAVGEDIRSPEVNAHVARMSAVPAVRSWLLGALRDAGRPGGLVADGRDLGTVVFPDAELKVFLVCEPEVRAARRLKQQGIADPSPREIHEEAARLVERDSADESRPVSPLRRADDAVVVDTTDLDFDAQVEAIVHLARDRMRA